MAERKHFWPPFFKHKLKLAAEKLKKLPSENISVFVLNLCMIIPCSSIDYSQTAANVLVSEIQPQFVCSFFSFANERIWLWSLDPMWKNSAPEGHSEGQRAPH